jgi:hypothetical protein
MRVYKAWNGPMPTTAALGSVSTGTTIKTMLQVATPSTQQIRLISWGYSIDAAPGADSVVELLETDVAATVTAHVAAGVQPQDPGAPASLVTLGTSATGYTASAEGSITAARVFDAVTLDAVAGNLPMMYSHQWMPDGRPVVAVSKFLRVRVTTPTSGAGMRCWVCWEE